MTSERFHPSVIDRHEPLFPYPNSFSKIASAHLALEYLSDIHKKAQSGRSSEEFPVLGAKELANLQIRDREWLFAIRGVTDSYVFGRKNNGYVTSLCGVPLKDRDEKSEFKLRWNSNDDFMEDITIGGLNEEQSLITENEAKNKLNINQPAYNNGITSMNYKGETSLQCRVVDNTMWEVLSKMEQKTHGSTVKPSIEVMNTLRKSLVQVSLFDELELYLDVIPSKYCRFGFDPASKPFPWACLWEDAYFEYRKYLLPPMSVNSRKITFGLKLAKHNKYKARELADILDNNLGPNWSKKLEDDDKKIEICEELNDRNNAGRRGNFHIRCINSDPVNFLDTLKVLICPK